MSKHTQASKTKKKCNASKKESKVGKSKKELKNEGSKKDEKKIIDFMEKLDEAQKEATDSKEKFLRVMADLENYRRRMSREKDEIRKNTIINLVEDLLPVLDNFSVGLKAALKHKEAKPFLDGFSMVHDQFKNFLQIRNVKTLDPKNEVFDPTKHEAISHVPNNKIPEDNIIEVVRVGYSFGERIIRPASVIISSGSEKKKK